MASAARPAAARPGLPTRPAQHLRRLIIIPRAASPSSPPRSPPPLPPPLFVVGSLNADLVLRVDRLPAPGETLAASSLSTFPGGKGGNQAVAASRLGHPTAMVGQVGGDGGDGGAALLLASLEGAGVDTRLVGRVPGVPTGTAVIMVQASMGENSIVIVGGANADGGAWADGPALAGAVADLRAGRAGGLLLQREIPDAINATAATAARAGGVPVILDAGGVDAPLPADLLACVDVLSPNETELARLTGLADCGSEDGAVAGAAALLEAAPGLQAVLVKRGSAGSILVEATASSSPPTITRQPAAPVPSVVDTTGAGDCFTAAYAVAAMRGLDAAQRLRYASAAAGLCVQRAGAGPSMPGNGEVEAALAAWGRGEVVKWMC